MNPTLESLKKPADVSHLAASLPPTITTCRLRDYKKRPHIGIRGHTCACVLGPAPLVLPHSLQVPHIRATMPSYRAAQPPAAPPSTSKGLVSVMLTPFMALAFVLLHAIYQLAILARSVASAVSRATRRRSHRPASSFASLAELLAEHECAPESVRVPDHLAVVLADAAPSSLRLYLSTQWMRLHSSNTKQGDFHATYQAAVEAKHVEDAATLIHLAAISGVRRLSIYTCEPLGAQALQHLTRHLHLAYKIRGVIHPTSSQQSEPSEPSPWKYTELRRRTRLRRPTEAMHRPRVLLDRRHRAIRKRRLLLSTKRSLRRILPRPNRSAMTCAVRLWTSDWGYRRPPCHPNRRCKWFSYPTAMARTTLHTWFRHMCTSAHAATFPRWC